MMKKVLFLSLLLAAACAPKDGIRTLRTAEGQEADLGKIKEIEGPVTVRLVAKNVYPDTLYPVQLYTCRRGPTRCWKSPTIPRTGPGRCGRRFRCATSTPR